MSSRTIEKKKSILTDWMWSETSQMGECLVSFNGNVRNCWLTVTFVRQFDENKVAWVAGLATIGAVEFMAAAVALFILRRLQVCVTFFPVWTILFFFLYFFLFRVLNYWPNCRLACVLALSHAGAYVSTKPTWLTILYLPSCPKNNSPTPRPFPHTDNWVYQFLDRI